MNSSKQMISAIANTTSISPGTPKDNSIEYYRKKYIEALEGRVVLHQEIASRDLELREKDKRIAEMSEEILALKEQLLIERNKIVSTVVAPAKSTPKTSKVYNDDRAILNRISPVSAKPIQQTIEIPPNRTFVSQAISESRYENSPIAVQNQNSSSFKAISSPRSGTPINNYSAKPIELDVEIVPENITQPFREDSVTVINVENNPPSAPLKDNLNGYTLIPWVDVIKSSHPGSLGHLSSAQRKRLEESIFEFLELKLSADDILLCRAKTTGKTSKEMVAIPQNFVEEFGDWLDVRMDDGMLDKANLDSRKKSIGEPRNNTPYQMLNSTPKEARPNPIKKPKSSSKEPEINGTPWPIILSSKYPDLPLDRAQFALYAKAFLAKKNLPERKVFVEKMSMKCLSIPNEFAGEFLSHFTDKFSYLDEIKSVLESANTQIQSLTLPEKHSLEITEQTSRKVQRKEDVTPDDSSRNLERKDIKQNAIHKSGLLLYNKILENLMPTYAETSKTFRVELKNLTRDFLAQKLGGVDKLKSECTLSYNFENRTRTTYGVPLFLENDYKTWANEKLRAAFGIEKVPIQEWENETL